MKSKPESGCVCSHFPHSPPSEMLTSSGRSALPAVRAELLRNPLFWTGKMAQWVKVLITQTQRRPDSVSRSYSRRGQLVLTSTCTPWWYTHEPMQGMCARTHTFFYIKNANLAENFPARYSWQGYQGEPLPNNCHSYLQTLSCPELGYMS